MSSSTSSSEPAAAAAEAASWRRWIVAFLATFLGLGGVLFVLLVLIDPYDSARFPNVGLVGINDHNPRMANVSRGRDQRFDSAVIGNSTGQLIDPSRIGPATGLSFTQLSIPKTGPREQIAMMEWFASRHAKVGAFVVVADNLWCVQDPALPLLYPFPFWLYGSDLDYLANVVNGKSLERAVWRIQLAMGMRTRSDPVGYSDSTKGAKFGFLADPPQWTMDPQAASRSFRFPGIEMLRAFMATQSPSTSLIIVAPPMVAALLGPPGSLEAAVDKACKAELQATVDGWRRGAFLDFRVDDASTRDPANFIDSVHYHNDVARVIEDRIVAALRRTTAVALAR